MSQAYELLLARYGALQGRPLAAMNPHPQALEWLGNHHIPTVSFVMPYRLEHPHSALVRRHAGLTRQDTLYTPAGRLTRKFARENEESSWTPQGAFVRRSGHLAALAAYWADNVAVPLPAGLFAPVNGDILWYEALPSPHRRLALEWVEPRLMAGLMKEPEGKACLKTLDALFTQEAMSFAGHMPSVIVMNERLTADAAADPLWRQHAQAAAAALRENCPDTVIAVTACLDGELTCQALPFDGVLLQCFPEVTDPEAGAQRLAQWLANPPEGTVLLLPPMVPASYPPLLAPLE